MLALGIGKEGQKKICSSTVAVVGLGALGSSVCEILVRAGVGRLFIFDNDIVELTNLQRQTIYDEKDLGLTQKR